MTLAAIIPITYDAVDVQAFASGIWLELASGIAETPAVRGEDTVIPDAAGSLEGNRINDFLALELRGSVRAADGITDGDDQRESYFANLLAVRLLFRPNRARADLVATLPGGVVLTISAQPLNIVTVELIPGEYAEVSVSLRGDGDWTIT